MTLQVHKFGGTSLAGADRLRSAASLVRACPSPLVVVVSAMGGVTNALVAAVDLAESGEIDRESLDTIARRHREAAADLGLDPTDSIDPLLAELDALLSASAVVRGVSPRIRDRILSIGEKLSARLLSGALAGEGDRPAPPIDADTFLETDGSFGEATPLFGVIAPTTRAALRPLLDAGATPIVTGFCGRAPCGSTTTLGRGGSDYSASLIAAALGADEVTIWTDVPGVYSANPSVVPEATPIPGLNYREAGELSYYGAKVLHPRAIQPLIAPGIPAVVRSTFEPAAPGTRIDSSAAPGAHPVKAVSAIPGQALLSIEGTGMAGVPGVSARIFGTLASEGISVTMISQSSAESSVCVAVPYDRATDAQVALRRAFRPDLAHADVEEIRVLGDVALIAAVGLGMNHTPGIAGRVFGAVARAGVNISAIAQGSSELNITFAVDHDDHEAAVRAIHREFALHSADGIDGGGCHADIMLLGFGRVSRALADLLSSTQAEAIGARYAARPRIVAIADRTGYICDADGIDPSTLRAAVDAKERGAGLATLPAGVATDDPRAMVNAALVGHRSCPILVDVADGDTSAAYLDALTLGADVVTANKAPLATPAADYHRLTEACSRAKRMLRREATAGAALPVLGAIENLLATGDRVRRIEGCLSGTLTFVFWRLSLGDELARVLADARARGYLEPNPLADLSGEDVRRKGVILARAAGFDPGDAEIRHEGLTDTSPQCGDAPPPSPDEAAGMCRGIVDRAASARAAGKSLRYIASIEPDGVCVGPVEVGPDSPFASLTGADNLVLVHSDRYSDSPLVIAGPGAGAELTASAVLTDILRILAERVRP